METTQLKFETNRKKAMVCPCGKSNRDNKFAPFKNFIDKGYCHSCDQTFFPESDYKFKPYIKPLVKIEPVPITDFSNSLNRYKNNNFALFLEKTFGTIIAEEIIAKYHLGTYGNKTIYWLLDENETVRTGQIISYNSNTGKRYGTPQWVHTKLKKEDQKKCLFGLHLINKNNNTDPIAIVEGQKTACIMSALSPDRIWLSTSGKGNLKLANINALKGRDVTLYPDHDGYDQWKNKAKELGLKYKIAPDCEDWFNEGLIAEGEDIADYFLKNPKFNFRYDLEWNERKN
tara:strand:+ start:1454 stop:2314 length:861 start_codon:yes stop_codon:yes gene_type:complete